jgi:hypothetical protein
MDKNLLAKLQVGATVVYDADPYLYVDDATYGTSFLTTGPARKPIYVAGADTTLPIVQSEIFSLIAFAEGAREMNTSMGAITGVRGNALKLISYGAQFRYFQDGFIPSYFDANYDLYRAQRFVYIKSTTPPGTAFSPSWLASLGFELFKSALAFRVTLDAPFGALPPAPGTDNPAEYPHIIGTLNLARGLIPNMSLAAKYEKFFLGKKSGNVFSDLVDLSDASIGMLVSYKAGSAVVSMDYAYAWNPLKNRFDVVSSLSVGFEL